MTEGAVGYARLRRRPDLRGRAVVERLRGAARRALAAVADRLDAPAPDLRADALGAPLAADGWHVSLTHAAELAAAAMSRLPVGIDAERTDRPRPRAARESARADELALLFDSVPADEDAAILLWTAKEAVLKRAGLGLTGLSRCRLVGVAARNRLTLELDGRAHPVEVLRIGRHWLSVAGEGSLVRFETSGFEVPA